MEHRLLGTPAVPSNHGTPGKHGFEGDYSEMFPVGCVHAAQGRLEEFGAFGVA
eukprot:CAMPEP_0171312024 /NCGR_PEP_ID=MMETSP0816-20121228/22335_1 /TAXON_ID=420281 /ORGANISM="Proboscia inermis, Strain CCAP1064/1" /LENGTH=52 /DNA_ID=CAMNT_0011797185 /DNA_START=15 /DNA_END=170 /DNA_ORIENTATION=-